MNRSLFFDDVRRSVLWPLGPRLTGQPMAIRLLCALAVSLALSACASRDRLTSDQWGGIAAEVGKQTGVNK